MNALSQDARVAALHLLVEGNSLRSVTRLTGTHRTTVMSLMNRAGPALRAFLDGRMRGLNLKHVQVDEQWTFVRKKQGRLTADEKNDATVGDQFLYIAIDQLTKLVPCFTIGKRTQPVTEGFMLDLAGRIITPPLGTKRGRPLLSTDGFAGYPGAVDLAFADTVLHGVLIKTYTESEQPGRYGPPVLVSEDRIPMHPDLNPDAICTSHVERFNLSTRTFMRRFTRLALGFSKKLRNLEAATALYVAHYNFCRWHAGINKTPAMAAGLTGHSWTMEELLSQAGVL